MRWKTSNRLDEKAQAYEKAADDELLWRVRRLLLPGEGIMDQGTRHFDVNCSRCRQDHDSRISKIKPREKRLERVEPYTEHVLLLSFPEQGVEP